MKVSDYIVNFFVEKGICDFFGYQGTMIAHFVDSIGNHEKARNHVCYNEQGASFAACGYSSATGKCGVAYATSGPGALNLVSGIANAYYDSIPVVFITGQINTYEYRYDLPNLRQAGYQETKTVEICTPITKYAIQITDASRICYELEKAYYIANTGRKGPVVLDIPMNIQRGEIDPDTAAHYIPEKEMAQEYPDVLGTLQTAIAEAVRPVMMLGNGVSKKDLPVFIEFAQTMRMPIVTSLISKDYLPYDHELNYGYLGGAYGNRFANMIVSGKSDLIVSIGCSLCTRQTGTKVDAFAPGAKVIRFDIDPEELKRKIKADEKSFLMDTACLAELLTSNQDCWKTWKHCAEAWLDFCKDFKRFAEEFDDTRPERYPNQVVDAFNDWIQPNDTIVCDVGQHMMWVGQSIRGKEGQKILFSGAHGAMGYGLPAALGASVAEPNRTVYCFCGDGAVQMNIQELQWLKREHRDIVVVVFNNQSLGMITQLQEAYFDETYHGTDNPQYTTPAFAAVAQAYGIDAVAVNTIEGVQAAMNTRKKGQPFLLEFDFGQQTRAYPKTVLGEEIYNQEPYLPQEEMKKYMADTCEG